MAHQPSGSMDASHVIHLWCDTTAHVMLSFPYISKLIKNHQHHYSSQLVCNTSHGEYAPGPGIADTEDAAEDTERSLGVDGYVIVPWRAIFHLYIEHIYICIYVCVFALHIYVIYIYNINIQILLFHVYTYGVCIAVFGIFVSKFGSETYRI